ncbi:uncharacterized protein LOC126614090 [Malus sylvestris]|uniref:uncharacterized protein LOC126614090 n=1 Tax=Malus sylvestris TaxID=3752 RepID=UPI0021AC1EC6|nr:uncharacterized protein LOC126614090 [Malus sylvestris]
MNWRGSGLQARGQKSDQAHGLVIHRVSEAQRLQRKSRTSSQVGKKPQNHWLKFDFDGAWVENEGIVGVGVIVRDHLGKFVAAMAMQILGVTSPLHAEMEAARAVVLFAQKWEANMVEFEGDASLVIVALNLDEVSDFSPLVHVTNDARHFLRAFPQIKLSQVRREGNMVAHRLARCGLSLLHQVSWFEELPNVISDLLVEDSNFI